MTYNYKQSNNKKPKMIITTLHTSYKKKEHTMLKFCPQCVRDRDNYIS